MDAACVGQSSWSIITSSATNSQLAGILAGFMVTIIAVLVAASAQREITHTIALFSAGALDLGLTSYLFSGVTGARPPAELALPDIIQAQAQIANGDATQAEIANARLAQAEFARQVCKVVWSQGMVASGLLAVGGTVFVCGLGWMLLHHAAQGELKSYPQRRGYLVRLSGVLAAGIIIATTFLLGSTTIYYLKYVEDELPAVPLPSVLGKIEPDVWNIIWVSFWGAAVLTYSIFMIAKRTNAMRCAIMTAVKEEDVKTDLGALSKTTLAVASIAIAGTAYAGVLNHWRTSINSLVIVSSVAFCLLLPGFVSILIARSVPTPETGSYKSRAVICRGTRVETIIIEEEEKE